MYEMHIPIRAEKVINHENGTYTVILIGQPVTDEDRATLERLLPDFGERVHDLLCQQALLHSLASPSEVVAKKPKK